LTAFRILISVQPASGNGLLEIVFAFIQRGRALSSVAIIRGGVSIPVSLRNGLIDRTAFKLRRL